MNIKLFFEITREFFDAMYSIYVEEEKEDKNVDEEKGLEQDDEYVCYYDPCYTCRQIFLVIDQNMYENKFD